jgi:hypothetical protein
MAQLSTLALVTGATLFAAGIATPAAAQWLPRGWHVIGTKVVNGRRDTDAINLPGRQAFRQLRLCAFNAPLHMRDLQVYYGNGVRQDLRVRQYIAPGTCTRNIDLRGRARDISQVRLKYDRIAPRARAPLVRIAAR